jgi:hypothetical protein
LVGAVIGYLLLVYVLIPRLGLGDVQRIIYLGRHLDGPRPSGAYAVFLGDSITRQAVDASIVQSTAPGQWRVENFALSECMINEQRIMLPHLFGAQPDLVVLAFGPINWLSQDDLPLDKAYAYAMAGFVTAWPEPFPREDFPGLSRASYQALFSSPLAQRLHFRSVPLTWLNQRLRLALRKDLRDDVEADWIRPYRMLGSVPADTLAWHVSQIRQNIHSHVVKERSLRVTNAQRLVQAVSEGGARPLLVVLPIHPQLRADAEPLLAWWLPRLHNMGHLFHGAVVDASAALDETQFADAIHPNAQGREVYSRLMGTHFPAEPTSVSSNSYDGPPSPSNPRDSAHNDGLGGPSYR